MRVAIEGESPPSTGHKKNNQVAGCSCRYCEWRRANKRRSWNRNQGTGVVAIPVLDLRHRVRQQMGEARFLRLWKEIRKDSE